MNKIFLLLLLMVSPFLMAQTNINNYKYIIVPSKFSFLYKNDEYRLNTLAKLLVEKYGFVAFLDTDEMPEELVNFNCNKLFFNVSSEGGFITTKLIITIKDCKNNILFTSAEGKSKEKEYKYAYNEALRKAFQSFETLHYKYIPTSPNIPLVEKPKTANNQETTIVNATFNDSNNRLFAQPIANGFQLVDDSPKVVMKIFKTSNPSNFIATKGNLQGFLMAKNDQWFFEYYQDDKLISEKIEVKF